jgi:hypothetical protein
LADVSELFNASDTIYQLIMKAVSFLKLRSISTALQVRNIPEDSHLHTRRRDSVQFRYFSAIIILLLQVKNKIRSVSLF